MEASGVESTNSSSGQHDTTTAIKRNKIDDDALKGLSNIGDAKGLQESANNVEDPMSVVVVTPDSSEYFSSYEDLNVHRLMLNDKVRTNAYLEAITGASSLFKDKVVMDVGAGTGILSLFCARAGARKVYAVEASTLATIIPKVATKNGLSEIISVIHSKVEEITDVEEGQVDIIVSEWMGFYLLHESMLDSVIHARDKFLRSGGLMFPNTAQIYAAPCSIPEIWGENIEFWSSEHSHYGFDLSPFLNIAKNITKPLVEIVPSDSLMSDPQLLFDLNLQTIQSTSLQNFNDKRFFSVEKTGDIHAVCIWFTCTFPVVPEKEPVELSTAPWTEETHWKQTIILLPDKIEFDEGDITGWELKFEKSLEENSRSYTIDFQCLDGDDEHPVPCECGMVKCEIIKQFLGQAQPQEDESLDE